MTALRGLGVVQLALQALLTGAVAGCVIGAFRLAYTWLNSASAALLRVQQILSPNAAPWLALLALFACLTLLGLVGFWLVRRVPLISGSGIPQVELVLAGRLPAFSWWRVLAAKFVGTLVSLTGGLAVGREGPCIQMGACVGAGVGRLWQKAQEETQARSLVGGCVAGMTAAFGAPVAGMAFAFEDMRTPISPALVLFCGLAAAAAELVVSHVLGLGLVFPFGEMGPATLWDACLLLPLCAVAGVVMGLFGAGYNALLVGLTRLGDRAFGKKTCAHCVRVLLAFWLAGALVCLYPTVIVGLGPGVVEQAGLALAWPLGALLVLLACKVLFSCLSFASTVAGGLLMPMLGVGALCGACLHGGLHGVPFLPLPEPGLTLTLCMAALFAATVRAPLTGAALLLEMTGAWHNPLRVPLVVGTAWLAAMTANACHSEPVYDSLKRRILANNRHD